MRILAIHADYIEFEAKKKAFKAAEEDIPEGKQRVEECLVIFTAVEKRDEAHQTTVLQRYVQEIKNIASQISAKNIVLYPYAHLSSTLASPQVALEFLKSAAVLLQEIKFKVVRAPFGWYKSFNIACKGHPLSELSREFSMDDSTAVPVKEKPREKVVDRETLLKRMSKIQMSSDRSPEGLKSNVELGRELDLYFTSEIIGGGLPLLTPRGATIKREMERFIVDEELQRGYLHTATPVMAKSDLYKISGHWDHYQENMFVFSVGEETFALRPMTCPFQFTIYKSKPRSHRDLPLKYAEVATLFRNEKSGELMGLTRLRQFTLADAHVICLPEQLEEEFGKVIELIHYVVKVLKLEGLWYRFSKWDPANKEKYVNEPEAWEHTQQAMKRILDKLKIEYIEASNEAAFYGPKLDVQYKNIFGKEDTLLTVQIDFALPERFDLTYIGENNEKKRPMVIHRSSVGCLERTMAFILEKTQGNLPLWLNPLQVKIVTITDRNIPFAQEVLRKMSTVGIRVELDDRVETMGKKVREAVQEKVNYIVTIGDKEMSAGTLAIRTRAGEQQFGVKVEEFLKKLKEEVEKRL